MDRLNRSRTPAASGLLEKALTFLDAVLADDGNNPITEIAARIGVPQATAYRLAAILVGEGLLMNVERGRYLSGPRLLDYATTVNPLRTIARIARPLLDAIARRFGQDAHLGVIENGMVTYAVKAGEGAAAGFARQGAQLEAYCSGVGKVLLAHLAEDDLTDYLANGPFIRLTANTIIAPEALRDHLKIVRVDGYAVDDEEIAEGLRCIAVPVRDHHGRVIAAISVSAPADWLTPHRVKLARRALDKAASAIHDRLAR